MNTPSYSPNPRAIARVGNVGIITLRGKLAEGHWAHAYIDAIDIPKVDRCNFHANDTGAGQFSAQNGEPLYYAATSGVTPDGRHTTIRLQQIIYGPTAIGNVVDHIDGDPMNNRRNNLQELPDPHNLHEGKRRKRHRNQEPLPMAA